MHVRAQVSMPGGDAASLEKLARFHRPVIGIRKFRSRLGRAGGGANPWLTIAVREDDGTPCGASVSYDRGAYPELACVRDEQAIALLAASARREAVDPVFAAGARASSFVLDVHPSCRDLRLNLAAAGYEVVHRKCQPGSSAWVADLSDHVHGEIARGEPVAEVAGRYDLVACALAVAAALASYRAPGSPAYGARLRW